MPRVIGIDPGTVSIDLCGLADGNVWLDRTIPTREALADPAGFLAQLTEGGIPDLIAGPSGYGLPMIAARDATETDLRLALLSADGEAGGISGLGTLLRLLCASALPVIFTPGVMHLPTVPPHRKLNRIDLGTADKVAAAALGIWAATRPDGSAKTRIDNSPAQPATQTVQPPSRRAALPSFILLELGGAFSAAIAVAQGAIVDGVGGTGGPMGWQSAGGWDGETAFLAGPVTKELLFRGGRLSDPEHGLAAFIESAHKAVLGLTASVPQPDLILLSGRQAGDPEVRSALLPRLSRIARVEALTGFAKTAKQGAQGAALIADGLAGGAYGWLVDALRLREAGGTVLDGLRVISRSDALGRLGLPGAG